MDFDNTERMSDIWNDDLHILVWDVYWIQKSSWPSFHYTFTFYILHNTIVDKVTANDSINRLHSFHVFAIDSMHPNTTYSLDWVCSPRSISVRIDLRMDKDPNSFVCFSLHLIYISSDNTIDFLHKVFLKYEHSLANLPNQHDQQTIQCSIECIHSTICWFF